MPAIILCFEFLFGGQLRMTSLLTPALHDKVTRLKAAGTAEALQPVIPIRDPKTNQRMIGLLMCITGVLWGLPATRGWWTTLGLSEFLTGAGIYR